MSNLVLENFVTWNKLKYILNKLFSTFTKPSVINLAEAGISKLRSEDDHKILRSKDEHKI